MNFTMLQSDKQRVGLAVSKVGARAREWAFSFSTSALLVFFHMGLAETRIYRVFALPNQTYRVRSRFLSARQGKKELSDYVQELRTLIASLQLDPLPEMVLVTIFMEGLRTGVDRTEVFQIHPSR